MFHVHLDLLMCFLYSCWSFRGLVHVNIKGSELNHLVSRSTFFFFFFFLQKMTYCTVKTILTCFVVSWLHYTQRQKRAKCGRKQVCLIGSNDSYLLNRISSAVSFLLWMAWTSSPLPVPHPVVHSSSAVDRNTFNVPDSSTNQLSFFQGKQSWPDMQKGCKYQKCPEVN